MCNREAEKQEMLKRIEGLFDWMDAHDRREPELRSDDPVERQWARFLAKMRDAKAKMEQ